MMVSQTEAELHVMVAAGSRGSRLAILASHRIYAHQLADRVIQLASACGAPTPKVVGRQLRWPNGSVAYLFGEDRPYDVCGPEFGFAWLHDVGESSELWARAQPGFRLGRRTLVSSRTTQARAA